HSIRTLTPPCTTAQKLIIESYLTPDEFHWWKSFQENPGLAVGIVPQQTFELILQVFLVEELAVALACYVPQRSESPAVLSATYRTVKFQGLEGLGRAQLLRAASSQELYHMVLLALKDGEEEIPEGS